ncbi:Aliphatic amidase AmiE [hydrothermal vent metagenome]|uniref:Aliphatic amidase AmiE n=1 Tax=hydrothermal vent metagenome TaxID=652676 RepID=A0A3B0ULI8_9ZZZZ
MKRTISLGQMDVKLGDPVANWHTVQQMAVEAARRGSDLIVLPELWSTGYDLENAASYATRTDEGMFAQVAALAQELHIEILGSCLSLLEEGQFGNTAVYFDANGRSLGEYSKLHLFRLMQEEQYLTAGAAPTLVETAWGRAGLSICYDLRFPEFFRHYALAGAQVVFLPAEWPYPRLAHWRTLLRARAIENQMFVVACNRVGSSKGSHFFGHSCIVDPWGEIVVEAGEDEMLLTAVIDIGKVAEVRAKIPVFKDRRSDIY